MQEIFSSSKLCSNTISITSVVPLPAGYRLDAVIVPRTLLVSLAPTDSLILGLQPLLDSHLILY